MINSQLTLIDEEERLEDEYFSKVELFQSNNQNDQLEENEIQLYEKIQNEVSILRQKSRLNNSSRHPTNNHNISYKSLTISQVTSHLRGRGMEMSKEGEERMRF